MSEQRPIPLYETALLAASDALEMKYGDECHARAVRLVKAALAELGWASTKDMDPQELQELLADSGLTTKPVTSN